MHTNTHGLLYVQFTIFTSRCLYFLHAHTYYKLQLVVSLSLSINTLTLHSHTHRKRIVAALYERVKYACMYTKHKGNRNGKRCLSHSLVSQAAFRVNSSREKRKKCRSSEGGRRFQHFNNTTNEFKHYKITKKKITKRHNFEVKISTDQQKNISIRCLLKLCFFYCLFRKEQIQMCKKNVRRKKIA